MTSINAGLKVVALSPNAIPDRTSACPGSLSLRVRSVSVILVKIPEKSGKAKLRRGDHEIRPAGSLVSLLLRNPTRGWPVARVAAVGRLSLNELVPPFWHPGLERPGFAMRTL